MTLSAGTRLGPYEILSRLGAGGMGEVYKARDTRLGREVAIKVLAPAIASDAEYSRRFEQEARSASALADSHIVTVFDVGEQNGIRYFASELVEGGDLRARVRPEGLPLEKALEVAEQIAFGLASAHAKGITHRDLKPENVLLTKSGQAKIADFGLAKLSETPGEELSQMPTAARVETTAGLVMGTVSYMSPEQAGGRKVDYRSDQFSFGVILFELLTGRIVFRRETPGETLAAILRDEPPPITDFNPSVPAPVSWILERCLAKDPDDRYASTRDLARDVSNVRRRLSSISAADPAARPRDSARRSREPIAWTLAAAGALLAVAALWFGRRTGQAAGPLAGVRFTIAPPKDMGFTGTLALSPDGRNLAFAAAGADGRLALWVRPLDSLDARRLEGSDGAQFPFWSPDGHSIGYFAAGRLLKIDPHGGAPQALCDAAQPRGGTWSAGGTIVFSANLGGELQRVSDAGGTPAALTNPSPGKGESFRWPAFLPDGRHLLYFVLSDDPKRAGIHVGSLDSAETSYLAPSDAGAVFADGFLYSSRGDRLVRQAFDTRSLRLTGDAVPLAEDIRFETISTGAVEMTAAAGTYAWVGGGMTTTDLLELDRAGQSLGRIGPPGSYIEPAFSPDGRWVAVSRFDPRTLLIGIWTFDLERGILAPVSPQTSFAATPVWSPDARRLAYSKFPSGGIYARDAHATQPEKLLVAMPSFAPIDDWSRDGRSLLWDSVEWKKFHSGILVHDLETGRERPFLESRFDQSGGRFSPDGKWIAYESNETGATEVFVRSFPASDQRWQVSVGGGDTPRWRGDGRELYYVSSDRKITAVEIRTEPTFEAGPPRALFPTQIIPNIEARNNYDVTADGRRFLVNSRRAADLLLPVTVVVGRPNAR
jgi:Tol biopolymer transport system component